MPADGGGVWYTCDSCCLAPVRNERRNRHVTCVQLLPTWSNMRRAIMEALLRARLQELCSLKVVVQSSSQRGRCGRLLRHRRGRSNRLLLWLVHEMMPRILHTAAETCGAPFAKSLLRSMKSLRRRHTDRWSLPESVCNRVSH